MNDPLVSVILPVRNGGDLLAAAVQSILAQRDCAFELLVIDDGSSDGTPAYLARLTDSRLRVLRREGGGLVAALNAGITATKAPLIARMDADDIALPDRLARQAAVFAAEGDAAIVFSAVEMIDGAGRPAGRIEAPAMSADERRAVLLDERDGPPIIHPTVMFRRDVIEALGGYREVPVAEDHDLWLRAVDRFAFRPIAEPLLRYRHHGGGVSRARAVEQSISGLMNVVNFRVRRELGVDLFVDRSDLYAELRGWVAERHAPFFGRVARARQIRSDLKRGDRLGALIEGTKFAMSDAALLTRAGIRRATACVREEARQRALRMLYRTDDGS